MHSIPLSITNYYYCYRYKVKLYYSWLDSLQTLYYLTGIYFKISTNLCTLLTNRNKDKPYDPIY